MNDYISASLTEEDHYKYLTFWGIDKEGLPASFTFNKPREGATNVLYRSPDYSKWFSKDAGLTWENITYDWVIEQYDVYCDTTENPYIDMKASGSSGFDNFRWKMHKLDKEIELLGNKIGLLKNRIEDE